MSRNISEFYIANRKHRTDGNLFVVLAFFVDKTFFCSFRVFRWHKPHLSRRPRDRTQCAACRHSVQRN
nr:MAG TPA: hypothetical protein [Bacteriophage sp.]